MLLHPGASVGALILALAGTLTGCGQADAEDVTCGEFSEMTRSAQLDAVRDLFADEVPPVPASDLASSREGLVLACGSAEESADVTLIDLVRVRGSEEEPTKTADVDMYAELRADCDRIATTFRSGGLGDADQFGALASELRGLTAELGSRADLAVEPLIVAAQAIRATGRDTSPPDLITTFNNAYERLSELCRTAGSESYG